MSRNLGFSLRSGTGFATCNDSRKVAQIRPPPLFRKFRRQTEMLVLY